MFDIIIVDVLYNHIIEYYPCAPFAPTNQRGLACPVFHLFPLSE